jgi:LuxR family maltose regulon positive regulatory protein
MVTSRCVPALQAVGGVSGIWPDVVDLLAMSLEELLPGPAVCVLDDYHLIDDSQIAVVLTRLVECMPLGLHLMLTTQARPGWPGLARWYADGRLTSIGRRELEFQEAEQSEYFRQRFGIDLEHSTVEQIARYTEGWPIAMHLVGRALQDEPAPGIIGRRLAALPGGWDQIHDYLREHVLGRHNAQTREFLMATAPLHGFNRPLADWMLGRDSAEQLRHIAQWGLFLVSDGTGGFRYQHWFRDFLRGELDDATAMAYQHRAADYFRRRRDDLEVAAYHAVRAGDHDGAAGDLDPVGGPSRGPQPCPQPAGPPSRRTGQAGAPLAPRAGSPLGMGLRAHR